MPNLTQLQVQDPGDFNGGQPVSARNPLPVVLATASAATATITYVSGSAISSLVVKASQGALTFAYAIASAAGYLIAIDAVQAPASGTPLTAIALWPAAANQQTGGSYTDAPLPVSTGLVLLMSSSATVYAPISATFLQGGAR